MSTAVRRSPAILAIMIWLSAAACALVLDPYADPSLAPDPTRYCYAVVKDQPWSCYLDGDQPAGHHPVWVGPQSKVNDAFIGDRYTQKGES